ncbi:unnamed protein product, partial [marine sediment metagenome]
NRNNVHIANVINTVLKSYVSKHLIYDKNFIENVIKIAAIPPSMIGYKKDPIKLSEGEVRFYTKSKNFEFSNFYPFHPSYMRTKKFENVKNFSFEYDGHSWKTVEHAYQAHKFMQPGASQKNFEYAEYIKNAPTAGLAAKLGNVSLIGINLYKGGKEYANIIKKYRNDVKIRDDWEDVKLDIMIKLVKAKFDQHEYLRKLLLQTDNKKLIEASPRDYFWGEGKDKTGKNYLGRILMNLRWHYTPK